MVVGVIIEKFNQMSGRGMLTSDQQRFKDIMIDILSAEVKVPDEPPRGYQGKLFAIISNPTFETATLIMIAANSVVMAAEHYGQTESFTTKLDILNMVFVYLFTLELVLRLVALGLKRYFRDPWNCFDFSIVVGCLAIQFLDATGIPLQAFRPVRLLLVFRMIRRAKGIKLMVGTLLLSLPAMFNICCLLFLVFFIWAIIGMQLFAQVRFGEIVGPHVNFRDFGSSMLLLVRCVTGENWNVIMHDLAVEPPYCTPYGGASTDGLSSSSMPKEPTYGDYVKSGYYLTNDCGNYLFSIMYFMSFYVVGIFTIMNLFVAVILDNFSFFKNLEGATVSPSDLKRFQEVWFQITMNDRDTLYHRGHYMKLHHVKPLMEKIGKPLGAETWEKESEKRFQLILQEARHKSRLLPIAPTISSANPLAEENGGLDVGALNNLDDSYALDPICGFNETASLTPKQGPDALFSTVLKTRKLEMDQIPTEFRAIGYKQMQYILTLTCIGLGPLPYEDQQNRILELEELTAVRAVNVIAALYRGRKSRQQAVLAPETNPENIYKAAMFKKRAQKLEGVQPKQEDKAVLPQEETKAQDSGGLSLPSSVTLENTSEQDADHGKIKSIFHARAQKRKDLRARRRTEIELTTQPGV